MVNISETLFWSLLLLVWYAATIHFCSNRKQQSVCNRPIQHPPRPRALPIIGHLHLLGAPLTKSLQALANRYGPLMRLRMASSNAVVVSNVAIAKEILKDNEMNFVSKLDFGASNDNIYGGLSFFNAEYGAYWRFLRKLSVTELLSVPQVNRFAGIRRQEMMELLKTLVDCHEGERICNLSDEFKASSNNMLCRTVMSTRCSASLDESKLVQEIIEGFVQLAPKLSFGELLGPLSRLDLFGYRRRQKKLILKFDAFVESILLEHERDMNSNRGKETKDMMDILLEIHRNEDAEMKLSRNGIKNFLLEVFVAGTESTSVALQWTIAELINHPEVFARLREEINTVVGSRRLVEESDVPNLPFLQALVKESLRLHSPAPLFLRKCGKDCKINSYDLLADERIMFNSYAIMRDPSSCENPNDFLPERFMEETNNHYQTSIVDRSQNLKAFTSGFGRRGCPGEFLASVVIQVVVAAVVQCFDFKVQGGEKINMEEGTGFSASMAHPILCYPVTHINPLLL